MPQQQCFLFVVDDPISSTANIAAIKEATPGEFTTLKSTRTKLAAIKESKSAVVIIPLRYNN